MPVLAGSFHAHAALHSCRSIDIYGLTSIDLAFSYRHKSIYMTGSNDYLISFDEAYMCYKTFTAVIGLLAQ